MVSSVQHTIKIKCYSGIKYTSHSQQMNLRNLQKKDRLNKVYNSDGEQAPKILNGSLFLYTYEKFEIFLPFKKICSVHIDLWDHCQQTRFFLMEGIFQIFL